MMPSTPPTLHEVVAGAASRLALRQQNLAVLVPVLLHDVNGSLNGIALSTELLSRLQQRDPADAASAADLLLRTKNELGRLKLALKTLENRVAPGAVSGQPAARQAPLLATLEEARAVLLPAIRRGQHELRLASRSAELAIASRPDDLFDLLAALCIITIEGAPARATLELAVDSAEQQAILTAGHAGRARAGIGLELHRELLRNAVAHAGGSVDWQQAGAGSLARMRLPLAPPPG